MPSIRLSVKSPALRTGHRHEQQDLVRRSDLGEIFRAEGPRHTHTYINVNHLGLHRAGSQATTGGRHTIKLLAEPFEACAHETHPPVDFERNVSAFVDNAAQG